MIRFSPLAQRRWDNFKANKRGFVAFWLFSALFFLTLSAEIVANDKPLVVSFRNELYFPILKSYPETTFGGTF